MMNTESCILFTGKETDKKYYTSVEYQGHLGVMTIMTVTNRETGDYCTGKSKGSIFALYRKLIETMEKR